MIRQPIVSVLGHVDHGKTTLLDKIRGSAVAAREAGGITQHIGATEIPIAVIEKICAGLLQRLNVRVTVPGLLFIDTPGHEAFTTLRKRGGALADLAILVVDVMEGFQPQTIEALNILRTCKTPFLVAANKIDKIKGWQGNEGAPFLTSFIKQSEEARGLLENRVYELVGKLYEAGFQAERFDRVEKFEKQVAVVPVSAKTGEGIPELLVMLIGLAQRYLEAQLETEIKGPAKGTVLEVKEEVGLGVTIDAIIYDGKIRRGSTIVVGGKREPIVAKVRSLLKPKPLDEIRDPRYRFDAVQEAGAACGIKIAAQGLEEALAGSPLRVVEGDVEAAKAEIRTEIEEVRIATQSVGIIVKADTLGSLEALVNMLAKEGVAIRKAEVGDISRRDVVEAEAIKDEVPTQAVILGFNVNVLKDAEERAAQSNVQIFQGKITYKLIEDYKTWVFAEKEREKQQALVKLTMPAKIRLLPNYVFRVSKPAIVGMEVLAGTIKTNYKLIRSDGAACGVVKGLQDRGENLSEAKRGMQAAIAIEGVSVGRQVKENDLLYSDIPEEEAKLLETKYKSNLSSDELEAFEEIKKIKRKENPFWSV